MGKLISAKDILAQKGYQKQKFDSTGFNELVAKFFLEHEVSATILIKPVRFVELNDAPPCGYIDQLDTSIWRARIDDPNDDFTFCDYILAARKGLVRPAIVVDEPFCRNAVYMLELMGGYIVKKQGKGRYVISLV